MIQHNFFGNRFTVFSAKSCCNDRFGVLRDKSGSWKITAVEMETSGFNTKYHFFGGWQYKSVFRQHPLQTALCHVQKSVHPPQAGRPNQPIAARKVRLP